MTTTNEARMHRTQVMLEEAQYVALRTKARAEGRSIGSLIREFVTRGLRAGKAEDSAGDGGLSALAGFVSDVGFDAGDHDEELYGKT